MSNNFYLNQIRCEVEDLAHYHCKDDGCEMIFRHEDGVREHGKLENKIPFAIDYS